jgi:hypothetical protein
MEYVITTDDSFDGIEALTIEALKQQGLDVRRTFSLRSATGQSASRAFATASQQPHPDSAGNPGYSVLLLYAAGAPRGPVGLLTLFERGGQMVISSLPAGSGPEAGASVGAGQANAAPDAASLLLAALIATGLDFCTVTGDRSHCVSADEITYQTGA